MIYINYYRIVEKMRESKAQYSQLEVGDIIATTINFGYVMHSGNVKLFVLDGAEYELVCIRGPRETEAIITTRMQGSAALYRVEPVYPPDVPVLAATER